jgi:hypothetical protein
MELLGSHVCELEGEILRDHRAFLRELTAAQANVPDAQKDEIHTLSKTPGKCSCHWSPLTRNTSRRLRLKDLGTEKK